VSRCQHLACSYRALFHSRVNCAWSIFAVSTRQTIPSIHWGQCKLNTTVYDLNNLHINLWRLSNILSCEKTLCVPRFWILVMGKIIAWGRYVVQYTANVLKISL
jgi:hypothetical protein